MAPIIGIMASANWTSGNASSYESIATATGTGSSGTITFSSIPSTYKHLQIRALMRNTTASTSASSLRVRFNSDTGSNYAHHTLSGDGSAAAATGTSPQGYINVANCNPCDSVASNIMGVSIIDVIDYASSTKNKVSRALSGADSNAVDTTFKIVLSSGLWVNTAAITTIDLVSATGSWTTATTFALYGIKGA
jgi:hypothetical protein